MSATSSSDGSTDRFGNFSVDDVGDTKNSGMIGGLRKEPSFDEDDDDTLILLSEQEFGNSSWVPATEVPPPPESAPPSKKKPTSTPKETPSTGVVTKAHKEPARKRKRIPSTCRNFLINLIFVTMAVLVVLFVVKAYQRGKAKETEKKKVASIDVPTVDAENPTTYPTTSPTVSPTETPGETVQYGDIVYFELKYDDEFDAIKNDMNITTLWLSGGRGEDFNLVMTRDLIANPSEGQKYFEWIVRSSVTESGDRFETDPKNDECVKYGDKVFLQVNRPASRWMSGGRGGASIDYSQVGTYDVVNKVKETWLTYQYKWSIRSNHEIEFGSDSNVQSRKDPKHGQCVEYTDILYLQAWWKPTHWLTGGRDENITYFPPNESRPMEQVYTKNINQVENVHLFQWEIHNCPMKC